MKNKTNIERNKKMKTTENKVRKIFIADSSNLYDTAGDKINWIQDNCKWWNDNYGRNGFWALIPIDFKF